MIDIVLLGITILFFVLCAAYAHVCDSL